MNTTKSEFNKRLAEINTYFDTLSMIDKGKCRIVCQDIQGKEEERLIDPDLSRILKANGFILLYNLIEATVRKSIDAILNMVRNDGLTYGDLSDKLKTLWINQEVKGKGANSIGQKVKEMAEDILNNKILLLTHECVNISGNIDAQKVRDIARSVGYNEPKDGAALKTIKDKRNHLAHGEYTFAEIGKDFSVNELMKYKDETEKFLHSVLDNVERYINDKKYKIARYV